MRKLLYLISMMLLVVAFNAQADYNVPAGYNAEDYTWLRNYMNAEEDGKKNWNKFFDNEPTWENDDWLDVSYFGGVSTAEWKDPSGGDGEKRLITLFWSGVVSGDFDVSALKELATLECSANSDLTSLNINGCLKLSTLECNNTPKLTSLDIVTGCPKLTQVYCTESGLTFLNVSGSTSINILYCSGNDLTALNVSGCTGLTKLDCSGNAITSLDISGCPTFADLSCSNNNFSLPTLLELITIAPDCRYAPQFFTKEVQDRASLSLDALGLGLGADVKFREGDAGAFDDWTTDYTAVFSPSSSTIELAFTFSNLPDFEEYTPLYYTLVKRVDPDDYHSDDLAWLRDYLDTKGNWRNFFDLRPSWDILGTWVDVVTWDDSTPKRIQSIEWTDKNLSGTLYVSGLEKLEALYCFNNDLTSLKVSGLTALTKLDCSSNQLTSLDLSACEMLEILNCAENELTSLILLNCSELTELNCYSNQLTSLDVSDCIELTYLDCSDNMLTSLDLSACEKLTALDCSYNNLSSWNISECPLTALDCSGNNLRPSLLPAVGDITGVYLYAPQTIYMEVYPGQTLTLSDLGLDKAGNIGLWAHYLNDFIPLPTGQKLTISANAPIGLSLDLSCSASNFPEFAENNGDTPLRYVFTVVAAPSTPSGALCTIELTLGEGIEANHSAGKFDVAEGEDLYLTFFSSIKEVAAEHIVLTVDGVETTFNDLGGNYHYSYLLSEVKGNHTVRIALREYPVTMPRVDGVTTTPGAGVHQVTYGKPFTFNLSIDNGYDASELRVFVNGNDVTPTLRSTVYTITIDRVTEPVSITIFGVKKGSTVGNSDIASGNVELTVDNGQLTIDSADGKAMDVNIYNLRGQSVAQRKVVGSGTFTLSAGIYLVRVDEEVYKVVVSL